MKTNDLKVTEHKFNLPSGMPDSIDLDQLFPTEKRVKSGTVKVGGNLPKDVNSPLPLNRLKFVGNDQEKASRRPQGITQKGRYIFNSWYFRDGHVLNLTKYEDNCKLSVIDTQDNSFVNLVPVQLDDTGNKFVHIDSHAGGIDILGNHLYLAGGKYIRVFDLSKLYRVKECEAKIKSNQKFIREYTYMIPEVGRMEFETPGNVGLAYLSIATIKSKKYFLVGNFYSEAKSLKNLKLVEKYKKGGKSMMWLLPAKVSPFIRGEASETQSFHQIDPLFPSGSEKDSSVSRIQGAMLQGNTLIMNRSFAKGTMQLLAVEYDDILKSTRSDKVKKYFSGTTRSPLKHEPKNWVYGCEDLTLTSDNKILTVSEFKDSRYIFSASLEDIKELMV